MQRIKKELQELQSNHEDWYRVVVGDNIFSLNVYIRPTVCHSRLFAAKYFREDFFFRDSLPNHAA